MVKQYSFNFGYGKPLEGVRGLIIATVAGYLLQIIFLERSPQEKPLLHYLILNGQYGFYPWQPLTYMFVHGSVLHLVFNMLFLWMFGTPYERDFGTKKFLQLYFISGVGTGIFLAFTLDNVVGASGAIFGILISFVYFWPNAKIYMMLIFPMKAKVFIMIIMGIELLLTIQNAKTDPVAHSAHLMGALIAFIYLQIIHKRYNPLGFLYQTVQKKTEKVASKKEEKKVIHKEEWVKEKVDDLLEKVSKHGVQSLTKKEKDFLDKVSMNYKSNHDSE